MCFWRRVYVIEFFDKFLHPIPRYIYGEIKLAVPLHQILNRLSEES